MEVNNILTRLFARLAGYREERPSAGTKYRLMGLAADIIEVTETLQREVLDQVSPVSYTHLTLPTTPYV